MSLVFNRKPMAHSDKTLQLLLEKFPLYVEEWNPNGSEDEMFEVYLTSTNLIKRSIKTIEQSRNSLQSLIDKLKMEYNDSRTKGNKKELEKEIEEIESETKFTDIMERANEMIFMLEARATEAASQADKFARKLRIKLHRNQRIVTHVEDVNNRSPQTGSARTATDQSNDETFSPDEPIWLSEDHSDTSREAIEEDFICRTLKPSQMKYPRFWGDEEELLEFWAVYETLVHQKKVLSTVEKMFLLKDSLRGRAK
ncbi:hypothetical protein RB195_025010 [Necator americanus]|uniref:Uncharacterized protein n=2 Tax=Necator americanus TaxID=51031 RepID=A0ABR1EQK8_NECAM